MKVKKILLSVICFMVSLTTFGATETLSFLEYVGNDATYTPHKLGADAEYHGTWGNVQGIMLGNYHYLYNSYTDVNVREVDISSLDMDIIESIEFNSPYSYPNGSTELVASDLGAFDIAIYSGGTGDADVDYNGTSLSLISKKENLSISDIEAGVLFENLNWNISDENYITFVITVDQELVPFNGNHTGGASYTTADGYTSAIVTGSKVAVPEPSTYALIFGAIALGFAVYRKR